MIEIVRASAGSGKTFALAMKYIRLLMEADDRYAYRHILAVTFTNKATEEMKSRILKELHVLATCPDRSDYLSELLPLFSSKEALKEKAAVVLTNILHDYSAFSVSTIDKFFQRALKAFAREIGQFPSYKVELDRKSLVAESVDRILDSIDESNRDLLEWLIDSADESLSKGNHFNIDKGLYEAAEGIKSEDFSNLVKEKGINVAGFYSKSNLTKVRKACKDYIRSYHEKVVKAARSIADAFSNAGIPMEHTTREFMSKAVNLYLGLQPEEDVKVNPTFLKNAAPLVEENNPEKIFPKKNAADAALVNADVTAAVQNLYELLGEPYRLYVTLSTIVKQTYNLGIVKEINDEFQALLKEKNVVSLDETNDILNRIISGTEAPFIYEKLGVRFEHFLLDEFQDTSVVQWENFKPLLEESNANDNENLIVGDIKQSIYRWRGGDWKLLATEVEKSLECSKPAPLKTNWRSSRNVIRFNNAFFQYTIEALSERKPIMSDVLHHIYSDVEQEVSPSKLAAPEEKAGSVEVTYTSDVMGEILSSIGKVMEAGGNYGQIAILVRNNQEGADIAKELSKNSIPVISDDALMVKASSVIARLVALLHYVDNDFSDGKQKSKKQLVNTYLAEKLDIEVPENYCSLADLCEGLLRSLRKNDEERFEREVPYVEAFMDELKDWTSSNGNNLRAFLNWWKDASPKLSSPGSSDAVRIFTIHKSKGLEFEYVIFPYTEEVTLYQRTKAWCVPDFSQVPQHEQYDFIAEGAYQVQLSASSMQSLFSDSYEDEYFFQTVDNLNIFYVALTRAKKGLHLISNWPAKKFLANFEKNGKVNFAEEESLDFNKLMYVYLHTLEGVNLHTQEEGEARKSFFFGAFYPYRELESEGQRYQMEECVYPSCPLNPEGLDGEGNPVVRDRLKFSSDAMDFFGDNGQVGVEASHRIRGTVLHQILSMVVVPEDLEKATMNVRRQGLLTDEQAEEALALLKEEIARVEPLGWFPPDGKGVRNELSIFDAQGLVFRPDRLILNEKEAIVIDYKFGDPEAKYCRQVARYAGLLEQMGYPKVKGYLWYVGKESGNIEEVR